MLMQLWYLFKAYKVIAFFKFTKSEKEPIGYYLLIGI